MIERKAIEFRSVIVLKNYVENYPRPQLIREGWENLDGVWGFAFDDGAVGEKNAWYNGLPETRDIRVPFTYETKMSGIGDEGHHNDVWYERELTVNKTDKRVLLHFEGSDYRTRVFLNGRLAGEHTGGYARFSFDITDLADDGVNRLTVHVSDSLDRTQPRGKQRWIKESFACWYVQTTGIWKSVWMEYAAPCHIEALKLTPRLAEKTLLADVAVAGAADGMLVCARAFYEGVPVGAVTAPVQRGSASLALNVTCFDISEWGLLTWTPEAPHLYDLTVELLSGEEAVDSVRSYFGMREIEIRGNQVLLNGRPLYQRLILDQGYWPDSHLTPPSEAALVEDIEKVMRLGYNGVRKHQKTEDERFLYWCDQKGLLVWSEFPAAYDFNDSAVEKMMREWTEIVRQNYSHPSIITWTPFNESWGIPNVQKDTRQQQFTEAVYALTKAMDPMRPVICNDGWYHTVSDIITLHDYAEDGECFYKWYSEQKDALLSNEVAFNGGEYAFAEGYGYAGQPVIISEYGGIAFDNGESGWGYGNKVADEADYIKRFASITGAVKKLDYCCGFCFTQVTDVQQEINGLLDMERNFKVDPEAIRKINLE